MVWQTMRIADLGTVVTGKTPSSNNPEHFGEDFPFITPTDMGLERIIQTERFISHEGYLKFYRQILPPKSICFVCIGATIGKICLTTQQSLTNQQINSVVVDIERHDPFFIYYLFSTLGETVKGIAGGAATPIVNKTSFENVEVKCPPLLMQRKIAAILSAYDDLIENNLRRIKILEEMAQNLYREWFIKFRFPGHQHARFIDSPLGRTPDGWEVVNLLDIVVVKYGKNLPTKNLNSDAAYPVYGAAKIIGKYAEYTREERTIITGCRGSVGEMQITLPKCFVTNNSFTFDVQQQIDFFWLFHCLKERGFADVIGGAAQPQITLDGLSKVQIVVPLKADRALFHEHAEDIYSHLWNLESRNICLRRTRDLLLPKLITGEVDVTDLDITVPEEVAA